MLIVNRFKKTTAFIFLSFIVQTTLAVLPETLVSNPLNLETESHKSKLADSPSKGNLDPETQASIDCITAAFEKARVSQVSKGRKALRDQDSKGGEINPLRIQPTFTIPLQRRDKGSDKLNAISGEKLGPGGLPLKRHEPTPTPRSKPKPLLGYISESDHWLGDFSNYNALSAKNGLGQDFYLQDIDCRADLTSDTLFGKCRCNVKLLPSDEIRNFESIFCLNCPVHVVVDPIGNKYIRLFHGTTKNDLVSFKKHGIQPAGTGDLGRGFYMSSLITAALSFGSAKVTQKKLEEKWQNCFQAPVSRGVQYVDGVSIDKPNDEFVMIMEVLVPFGLSVKKSIPSENNKTQVVQHYNFLFRNKFLFAAAILSKLKPKKGFVIKSDGFSS